MYVVRGTNKFRERMPRTPDSDDEQHSTTVLGEWYATVLFWKPQVVLFINERTLLPMLVPLAPARTVLDRLPGALADVLAAHAVNDRFIEHETAHMDRHRLAPTANRSVAGNMNEFAFLAEAHRVPQEDIDLLELSLQLAGTPCRPLYRTHVYPDRALLALVSEWKGGQSGSGRL